MKHQPLIHDASLRNHRRTLLTRPKRLAVFRTKQSSYPSSAILVSRFGTKFSSELCVPNADEEAVLCETRTGSPAAGQVSPPTVQILSSVEKTTHARLFRRDKTYDVSRMYLLVRGVGVVRKQVVVLALLNISGPGSAEGSRERRPHCLRFTGCHLVRRHSC